MTLEERVARLERSNRRLKRLAALFANLVLAVVAVVVLSAQGKAEPKTVEAERFILRDPDGDFRGMWMVEGDGSIFAFMAGKSAFGVTVDPVVGPRLSLQHKEQQVRLGFGPAIAAGMTITDPQRVYRLSIGLDSDGKPSLSLADKNGQNRTVLGVTSRVDHPTGAEKPPPESTITLFGADGKMAWRATAD